MVDLSAACGFCSGAGMHDGCPHCGAFPRASTAAWIVVFPGKQQGDEYDAYGPFESFKAAQNFAHEHGPKSAWWMKLTSPHEVQT